MKCPECQAENADDAKFCSLCFARFKSGDRSREAEQAAKEFAEKHKGSQLRCPSCGELSPLESPFCLKCAFVFEDPGEIMVDAAEVDRILQFRSGAQRQELDEVMSAPLILTKESDGAEIIRHISDAINSGSAARLQMAGRNGVTYAMKLIGLLSEDYAGMGKDICLKVRLISEGTVTELDEVEMEILIEGR
jgi:hypothetical protein